MLVKGGTDDEGHQFAVDIFNDILLKFSKISLMYIIYTLTVNGFVNSLTPISQQTTRGHFISLLVYISYYNFSLCSRLVCTRGKYFNSSTWCRHQMEIFSALLAICVGNSPVPGEFPAQKPVTRSFDVFFDLRLNKRLSRESRGGWFETLSCPLWCDCNVSLDWYCRCTHFSEGKVHFLMWNCVLPLWTPHVLLYSMFIM